MKRGEAREERAEARAAGGGAAVHEYVADLTLMSEVRALAEQVCGALRAHRRAREQRRRDVRVASADRGGARANVRAEPPRAVPAHQPAARSPRRRPRRDHRLGRPPGPGCSISATCSRSAPTRRWRAYGTSKLCNILFTRELARRAPELRATCFHPGVVRTGFGKNENGIARVVTTLSGPFLRSPLLQDRPLDSRAPSPCRRVIGALADAGVDVRGGVERELLASGW